MNRTEIPIPSETEAEAAAREAPPAGDTARAALDALASEFEQRRRTWSSCESARSWGRLGLFALLGAPWLIPGAAPWWAAAGSAVALGLFVWMIRRHGAALAQREAADRLVLVTRESLARAGGQVACVRSPDRPTDDADEDAAVGSLLEHGATWALTAQERDDLDLFARPVGVFGLLNRASTRLGARRIRDALEHSMLDADRIVSRQKSVAWLAQRPRERLGVLAALAALRTENDRLSRLVKALRGTPAFSARVPRWALRLWTLLVLATTVYAGVTGASGALEVALWPLPMLLANALALMWMRRGLREALTPWREVGWAARGLRVATEQAVSQLPGDGELGALRHALRAAVDSGALPRIESRAAWAEHGGLGYAILNGVTLMDVHGAMAVTRDVLPHRAELLSAVAAVADLDLLASLSCLAAEQPGVTMPQPATERTMLEIDDGTHPLIPPQRARPNSVRLDERCPMWVVTGSNMAGKSTFLRMIGVNVLLAQLGGPVSARRMRWTPMRLVSDLRARDDLATSESYFLSEVRHLRRLVSPAPGAAPVLGLIDEPFRGTNSQDQTAASVAVVEHLLTLDNLHIIATHDRALTGVCRDERARNFHFRENLGSDGLVFDYRLYEGPAQTRNALAILEREGYPAELVRRAREWQTPRSEDGDAR